METIQALLKSNSHHDRLLGFRCLFKNYSKEDIKSNIRKHTSPGQSPHYYHLTVLNINDSSCNIFLTIDMTTNLNCTVVTFNWNSSGIKFVDGVYNLLNRGIYKHEYNKYKSDIIDRLTDILYHDILLND